MKTEMKIIYQWMSKWESTITLSAADNLFMVRWNRYPHFPLSGDNPDNPVANMIESMNIGLINPQLWRPWNESMG